MKRHLPKVLSEGLKITSLGLGSLLVLIVANPLNPGYLGVAPHPYFLLACFWGCAAGFKNGFPVFLVTASAYFYFVSNHVDHETIESILSARYLTLPISILAFPSLLGFFTDYRSGKTKAFEETVAQKTDTLRDLEKIIVQVESENRRLTELCALHTNTPTNLLEQTLALHSRRADIALQALVDMTCDLLGAENCCVYLFDGKRLTRKAHRETDSVFLPEVIVAAQLGNYPLVRKAVETRTLALTSHLPLTARSAGEPHGMAIPLMIDEGQILGLIAVSGIDFIRYTPIEFECLKRIAKLGQSCLARFAAPARENTAWTPVALPQRNAEISDGRSEGSHERDGIDYH